MHITGLSGNIVDVNDEKELVVRSIIETELEHSSAKNGLAFSWVSNDSDIDAGDTRLFLKSTSNTPLILDRAIFLPSNVNCIWSINMGKDTTIPTGTEVIGFNISQSGNIAEAISYDDETSVADGTPVTYVQTETTGTLDKDMDGFVLSKGHYIQINQETESTSGRVILIGHYANPS